jgi:hypothetical protein
MPQWLDDFFFYLPGFASVPIVIAGMLALWLAWKLLRKRKKPEAVEKSPKT